MKSAIIFSGGLVCGVLAGIRLLIWVQGYAPDAFAGYWREKGKLHGSYKAAQAPW